MTEVNLRANLILEVFIWTGFRKEALVVLKPNTKKDKMPVMREIPWEHIDALSYGPVDYYTNRFTNWLHAASKNGARIVILPSPKDVRSWFTVSMASTTIRECAEKVGLTVMTENRLRKKGILKEASLVAKKKQPSRLPNAFEQLVITQPGVLEFVPLKS